MTEPEDELLAAELAFGLLDDPDRAAAEARCAGDPAFDALCERWRAHAAGFFADGETIPDARVWAAIERRLPANDDAAETIALRRAVRGWRAASAALALLAVIAGVAAMRRPEPVTVVRRVAVAAPTTVVLLVGAPDAGAMAIGYDRAAGRIAASSAGLSIGRHAAQLWVIPADGRPRALGLVRANVAETRIAPAEVRAFIAGGATLAVSVEPLGGSPTGLPTGPVILTGKVATS